MNWLLTLLTGAALIPIAFIVDTSVRLFRNYLDARKIGVPIRMIPISPLNPFWVMLDRKVVPFFRRLPFGNNSFTRYNYRAWEVDDRCQSHNEMGDMWVLVTPLKNWVYINEPQALASLYKRASDFPRPVFVNEVLSVFGPNIACAEGQNWRTQRKIITRCFNEQNNEIVWHETIHLAGDMVRYWASRKSLDSCDHDLRTLSLHILSRAGFGKSFKFQGYEERDRNATLSGNYKESLQTILENCILILALGPKTLSSLAKGGWWVPAKLKAVQQAMAAFQQYMTNLYEEEKELYSKGTKSDGNLMTLLVRASQDEAGTDGGLTESEIYGNMFTINFAGHDTTAHTFTFAVYFLAAYPKVQDWIAEEINAVFGSKDPSQWNYRKDFPRLKRCLSIMLETLRLYTPVPSIKWTDNTSQPIVVGGKTYILPPHSMIAPSYGSVQTEQKFWGDDSLEWNPSRWIKSSSSADDIAGNEEIDMRERCAFIGWSDGIRDCPGKKFSQVEFVGTMAQMFRNHRVSPKTRSGETAEESQQRVLDLIKNDSAPVLLLQMLHPERAPLVWREE